MSDEACKSHSETVGDCVAQGMVAPYYDEVIALRDRFLIAELEHPEQSGRFQSAMAALTDCVDFLGPSPKMAAFLAANSLEHRVGAEGVPARIVKLGTDHVR